jgi:hypothetical protein
MKKKKITSFGDNCGREELLVVFFFLTASFVFFSFFISMNLTTNENDLKS